MIAANHILAGGIIAATVQQPALAIPFAFLSHFILDALPHFGIQVKNGDVRARNNHAAFKRVIRIDVLFSVATFIALPIALNSTVAWPITVACMLAAIAPDFVWVHRYFKDMKSGKLSPKSRFSRFHKWIQWGEYPWAIPIDIVWAIASLALLAKIAV